MCAPAFGGAMYFRRKTSAGRGYLQIVESRREGDQVRQQVVATLGRFEDLRASGQATKDAADRASIVAALERQIAKGDKTLVGNPGYRRFLKTISQDHFAIDPDKVE